MDLANCVTNSPQHFSDIQTEFHRSMIDQSSVVLINHKTLIFHTQSVPPFRHLLSDMHMVSNSTRNILSTVFFYDHRPQTEYILLWPQSIPFGRWMSIKERFKRHPFKSNDQILQKQMTNIGCLYSL